MFYDKTQALLQSAAAKTLERIRQDRDAAHWKVQPLLEHLEANLFDPDLNVDQLKRACGVRDNSISVAFHAEVGQPPGAYITTGRLETAAELLLTTELPIWQISELVGYSSIQVFSRSFNRWAGSSPSKYRAKHQKEGEVSRTEAAVRRERKIDVRPVLREWLASERAEALEAREIWQAIHAWPSAEKKRLINSGLNFNTPALFEYLRRRSLEEGREDRRRGLQVAELALDSVKALEGKVDASKFKSLEAEAWANLGNAHRLVLDFAGAERALAKAEALHDEDGANPKAEAEILKARAALCLFQRRFDEALVLNDRAIGVLREHGSPESLVQALNLKGSILEYAGELPSGVPELREALELSDRHSNAYLALATHMFLIAALLPMGRVEEAEELLPDAWRLSEKVGGLLARSHVAWFEGRIRSAQGDLEAASVLLEQAREGFVKLQDPHIEGMVGIDLAALYLSQDRFREMADLATQLVALFTALEIPRETYVALMYLEEGVKKKSEAIREALEELRNKVEKSRAPGA